MKKLLTVMKITALVAAFTVITGCQSTTQISLLPPIPPGAQSSRLHFARPHILLADASALSVLLNGQLVIELGVGDWTTFTVASGRQMLAVKSTMGYAALPFDCQPNTDHYFRVAQFGSITPISEMDGQKLGKSLKFKPAN